MVVSSFQELEHLASTVWALAGGEGELCQTAITWLIINRMQEGGGKLETVCRDVLADGCRSIPYSALGGSGRRAGAGSLGDPRFCRLVIRVLEVLSRTAADPTDGARLFHRHDADPDWSRELEPVALIGAYFFYNTEAAVPAGEM